MRYPQTLIPASTRISMFVWLERMWRKYWGIQLFYWRRNLMNRYVSVLFIVYQITDLFSNEGRTTNFGHPAIKELSKCFYYSGKPDCLSSLFPKNFKTFPKPSLAMVCTCVSVFLTATTICERFFFYRSLTVSKNGRQEPTSKYLFPVTDMSLFIKICPR